MIEAVWKVFQPFKRDSVPEQYVASPHVWDRILWIWHTLWYLLVASSTAMALASMTGYRWWLALGLGLALAGWHFFLVPWHAEVLPTKQRLMFLYCLVSVALSACGILFNPAFYLLTLGLYPLLFAVLRYPLAIPLSVSLTAFLSWTGFLADKDITATIAIFGGSLISSLALGFFIGAIIRQSRERRRLIDELEATRKNLAEAERQAGAYTERQRLAREIHDTLAQGFTSIVMHLEAADQQLPPECSETRWHIDQARRTGRESLAEARHLVWTLRPEVLGHGSLTDAFTRIAERWSEENKLPAILTISGDYVPARPEVEIDLLRVLREALSNIRKHASAREVRISVSFLEDTITLDIHDDGAGFQPDQLLERVPVEKQSGFGLRAMRERIELLGGTLALESAPGEGTTVAVVLPLQRKAEA